MISKRLKAIIDWVDGNCLADIGCDHSYVACQAVLEKKVKKAYACDIAQGPLDNAKANIQKHHLENEVSCILSAGLTNVPNDIDCVVIAGMGGKMIQSILEQAPSIEGIHFLLSPHKDAEDLRKYLNANGFTILREQIVEDEHFYPVIDCIYSKDHQAMTKYDFLYGINQVKNEAYLHYISHLIEKAIKLLSKVPEDKRKVLQEQINYLKKEKDCH